MRVYFRSEKCVNMLNNNPKGEVFPVVHIAHVRDDLFVRTGLFRGERGLENSFYNVGQALKNTKTSQKRAIIHMMAISNFTGFPAPEYLDMSATNFH